MEELVEAVVIFPDDVEVRISGAPKINVELAEVELRGPGTRTSVSKGDLPTTDTRMASQAAVLPVNCPRLGTDSFMRLPHRGSGEVRPLGLAGNEVSSKEPAIRLAPLRAPHNPSLT